MLELIKCQKEVGVSFEWNRESFHCTEFEATNHVWKSFYFAIGKVGFYWDSMRYDGLPAWSLGLGIFRLSYMHCHKWESGK